MPWLKNIENNMGWCIMQMIIVIIFYMYYFCNNDACFVHIEIALKSFLHIRKAKGCNYTYC